MIIYQVLTRLFGKGKFSSFDDSTFNYLKKLGVSHVWYTGVIRHATGKEYVKGDPGSPYSISDYHDVNPYLADDETARMEEFKSLVDRTHAAGLKVIIDFIPNHVCKDYPDWQIPTFPYCDYDWTDTKKINYSHPDTYAAMYEIVRFWALKGVDGMRCDMIDLVPFAFFKYLTSEIKAQFPDFKFIGETYITENYRRFINECGFDLLYDKSGLYDRLRGIINGSCSAREITWNWQGLSELQGSMLNFLENHDEQRLASPQFAGSAQRGYAALAVAALFNNASFMLYFGQEAGENAGESGDGRTSIFNWVRPVTVSSIVEYIKSGRGLTRERISILSKYRNVLSLASKVQSWRNYDLCWLNGSSDGFNPEKHFAFLRYNGKKTILVACNFSSEAADMKIKLPTEFNIGEEVKVSVPGDDFSIISL